MSDFSPWHLIQAKIATDSSHYNDSNCADMVCVCVCEFVPIRLSPGSSRYQGYVAPFGTRSDGVLS